MNAIETARQRRFDAELAESLGNDVPAELAKQIVQTLHQAKIPRRVVAGNNRRGAWLAAAGLLLGVAVVAGVAKAREDQTSTPLLQATQDPKAQDPQVTNPRATNPEATNPEATEPKVAKLTNASVYVETAELPDPGDAVARLLAIASADRMNLVITDQVKGDSKIDLMGCNGNEAVQRIAAECNVQVSEHRGVFVIGGLGRSGQVGQRLTLQCEPISVRDFCKQVHAKTGVNFLVVEDLSGLVQCDVKDAPWRSVVDAACMELQLEAVGCGTVIAIRSRLANPDLQRIKLSVKQRPVEFALDRLAHAAGANIVIGARVAGSVSIHTFQVDRPGLMQAIAAAVHAKVRIEERGITRFEPSPPHWSSDLIMERAPIRQVLERNGSVEIAVPKTNATVSVYVRGASGRHVIDAILTAARLAAVAPKSAEPTRKK